MGVTTGTRDDDAFVALVRPPRVELHALCYRMLGSAEDADDAMQDVLLRAWRGLGSFEGRSALRTWLVRIATNTCLSRLARRPARTVPLDGPPAGPERPSGAGSRRPATPPRSPATRGPATSWLATAGRWQRATSRVSWPCSTTRSRRPCPRCPAGTAAPTPSAGSSATWRCGPRWRHLPTGANGQPAVGCYRWDDRAGAYLAAALDVLTVSDDRDRIAAVTGFVDPRAVAACGLPDRLPRPDVAADPAEVLP